MKVGIIRFPGSNCDFDTYKWFKEAGHEPFFIFHNESNVLRSKIELLVLPGGFAFGDRLYENATSEYRMSPGTQALNSPVMEFVHKSVNNIPILGICNGFQILTQAGLLPGRLEINFDKTFVCDNMLCKFSDISGFRFFNDQNLDNIEMNIPVAHGYGRYVCSEDVSKANPFLFYKNNPNGSMFSIAGVCNDNKTIWGMMPHPERSPKRDMLMKSIESEVEWI